jgi:hypothetical protein
MDWQWLAVIAALALALGYVARSTWRTWFGTGKSACGTTCGGCAKPAPAASENQRRITLPQV